MFEEVLYQLYFVIIGTERIFVLQDVHDAIISRHRHQSAMELWKTILSELHSSAMAGVFYNWRGHLVCDG